MPFDSRLFVRIVGRALADRMGPASLPAWARPAALLLGLAAWAALNLFHRLCWRLDDLLFPGYRAQAVERPVFIVGVARSGTTFLHRFLASDEESFTTIRTWEIVLAPAVVQKLALALAGRLDRALGSPAERLYRWVQARLPDPLRGIHEVGLLEPEEDEYLFTWCFASMFVAEFFPYHEAVASYARFDEEIPEDLKRRLMGFYRACVQRHLYALGRGRRLLSKNPAFCGKLEALAGCFPDAELVVLVRSPLETVPSYLSLLEAMQRDLARREPDRAEEIEAVLANLDHFYRKPVELAGTLYRGRSRVVRYPDLMGRFDAVVDGLYRDFGLAPGPAFRDRVRTEAARARTHRSDHRYSLARFGLDRAGIVARYREVFERFRFPGEA